MSNPLHHLIVAQEANSAAYRRLVQTSVPGECWDILVLTANNEKQAEGYRRELALRARSAGASSAFFPAIQRTIVVPDPPDRRAGSGGATLGVMQALERELGIDAKELARLRILLIHSGGASQRLPMYSPVGKIFSPLPLLRPDGQIATLFDHLYITLCALPEKLGPGMLILAGDVFLLFDHRNVTAPAAGVTAITMRVAAEMGTGHGVFVTNADARVMKTLQKVSVEEMRREGASDADEKILIDTGILFFDAKATVALAGLAGAGKRKGSGLQTRALRPIDLYEDITFALSASTEKKGYLAGGEPIVRKALWDALHSTAFRCMEVGGEFLHLGTTRQFRDAMTGRNPSPAAELFQKNVLTHGEWSVPLGPRVYHSALLRGENSTGQLGGGSVVEHSILGGGCEIGSNCVVSQAVAVRSPLKLPDDMLFFQVPLNLKGARAYAQVLAGTGDEFKGTMAEGKCTFLNGPIEAWMKRHKIAARDIWGEFPAAKQSLWTAKIFPVTAARDACHEAAWLCSSKPVSAKNRERWLKGNRVSMAMILESSDPSGLIEHRETVAAHLQTGQIIEAIRRREAMPLDVLFGQHSTPAAYEVAEQMLKTFASRKVGDASEALEQARAWWVLSQLASRSSQPVVAGARERAADAMVQAFSRVALASELGHQCVSVFDTDVATMPVGTVVEATSPVRLDLTGGWSDTPPYCYEEGGHVVNVAVDLNGRAPIRATVQRTTGSAIVFESRDLGKTLTTSISQLRNVVIDPHDPFALSIVALHLTGYFSSKPVGLRITTECRVPKGSGLGTSSILAATLLAALLRLGGRIPTNDELIQRTLLLEQRLSTGGGWQDQVGGLVGGIKSAVSLPGIPQRPIVEQLSLSPARLDELESRMVVYYSGQQRLARDILRRVEGAWLAREPAVVMLKRELKASAAALRNAVLSNDFDAVADEVNRYWRIKKQIFPGSTTPATDVLLLELQGQYRAASLAGAGSGGFGFFLCGSAEEASRLRDSLTTLMNRPGSLGSVYGATISRTGLQVQVKRNSKE